MDQIGNMSMLNTMTLNNNDSSNKGEYAQLQACEPKSTEELDATEISYMDLSNPEDSLNKGHWTKLHPVKCSDIHKNYDVIMDTSFSNDQTLIAKKMVVQEMFTSQSSNTNTPTKRENLNLCKTDKRLQTDPSQNRDLPRPHRRDMILNPQK